MGITAIIVIVAFVSFSMMDTNDISKTDTKLVIEQKQYTTAGGLLPPDDPLFFNIDFRTHLLDASDYDHLTEVFEKYDDVLVFDVYTEYEYDKSEEEELITLLRSGVSENGEPAFTEEELRAEVESYRQDDGRVIDDFTRIYLSQDPLDEDVYSGEFYYTLQGISIKISPKGDNTQQSHIEYAKKFRDENPNTSPRAFIYEVSPRITGILEPMEHIIQHGEPFDLKTNFSYFDDEHHVLIQGFLTNEQVSALAMAISEDKKQ